MFSSPVSFLLVTGKQVSIVHVMGWLRLLVILMKTLFPEIRLIVQLLIMIVVARIVLGTVSLAITPLAVAVALFTQAVINAQLIILIAGVPPPPRHILMPGLQLIMVL